MARIHCITHVPYEGPGTIEGWATDRDHDLRVVRVFEGDTPPAAVAHEPLIVMGGPMSAYDEDQHSWLAAEKACIARAIDAGAGVLGICLGAQLAAEVLGAEVSALGTQEVGWWPIERTYDAPGPLDDLPSQTTVFHWHSDTFTLPPRARRLASSYACPNQAFDYDDGRVLGLQFHPEVRSEHIAAILERNIASLEQGGEWVQSPTELIAGDEHADALRVPFWNLLDRFVARVTDPTDRLQIVG